MSKTPHKTANKATCRAVASAAFQHDVGKFAERAISIDAPDKDTVRQEYNYGHAYSTEYALERLFGGVVSQTVVDQTEQDATFVNLASRHHKPRYALERIIQVADQWASGHERTKADEAAQDYQTTGRERKTQVPLVSILGRVQLKGSPGSSNDWRYPLVPQNLAEDAEQPDIFPVEGEGYSNQNTRADYPILWDKYTKALGATANSPSELHPIEDLETVFEISRQHQWCIPASTRREDMPDVSLFEHAKGTAAIASCLYHFHGTDEDQTVPLQDKESKKFLLICADIAGIQNFIYQISSKGAYKLLKGRSFYVQLLSEIIARHLAQACGVTVTNILYASGGKCYLLLPNTAEVDQQLEETFTALNKELLQQFNGDLYVRHGRKPLRGKDLCWEKGRIPLNTLWEELTREVASQDRKRYAELDPEEAYDLLFAVHPEQTHAACEVCQASLSPNRHNGRCRTCTELQELGRALGVAQFLLVSDDRGAYPEKKPTLSLPLGYHVWCLEQAPQQLAAPALVLWSVNSSRYQELARKKSIRLYTPCAPLMLGSNHRFDAEFDDIAKRSMGVKRLGVLRMDVDNLGLLFSQGLARYRHDAEPDGRFHSLARITTLSWQLRLFFESLLPQLLRERESETDRITVVYSGGDDLFLLGAWDVLPEKAMHIRDEFSLFCCRNPNFNLSGGLVLTPGKFPIYKSAEMAGQAEDAAKQHTTKFTTTGNKEFKKSAFTFFDTPMHWEEFSALQQHKQTLASVLDKQGGNWPLLRRLREIAVSWEEERQRVQRQSPERRLDQIASDIAAEKWRWRMVYSLSRFGDGKDNLQPVLKDIQNFILDSVGTSQRSGIELLHVLVRWVEFLNRKSNN